MKGVRGMELKKFRSTERTFLDGVRGIAYLDRYSWTTYSNERDAMDVGHYIWRFLTWQWLSVVIQGKVSYEVTSEFQEVWWLYHCDADEESYNDAIAEYYCSVSQLCLSDFAEKLIRTCVDELWVFPVFGPRPSAYFPLAINEFIDTVSEDVDYGNFFVLAYPEQWQEKLGGIPVTETDVMQMDYVSGDRHFLALSFGYGENDLLFVIQTYNLHPAFVYALWLLKNGGGADAYDQ